MVDAERGGALVREDEAGAVTAGSGGAVGVRPASAVGDSIPHDPTRLAVNLTVPASFAPLMLF
jgi:hypothetical protein